MQLIVYDRTQDPYTARDMGLLLFRVRFPILNSTSFLSQIEGPLKMESLD